MEIGQKPMEIANKKDSILTNRELSIQISLNGLSFCILEKATHTISYLKHITSEKKVTPFKALDLLKHAFVSETALQTDFDTVLVVYVNELSTFVPQSLFNEDHLADYLKFNAKILKSDYITYDLLDVNDSVNVYVPFVNINNFIYEKFGAFSYKHFSTVLIETILKNETPSDTSKLYLHVCDSHFEIIVTKNSQLQLYNTFEYTTKEDFIYYVLFAVEQLELDPETVDVILLGAIFEADPLYDILYKYIRHVRFGSRKDSYKYHIQPASNHTDFTLIHSL